MKKLDNNLNNNKALLDKKLIRWLICFGDKLFFVLGLVTLS